MLDIRVKNIRQDEIKSLYEVWYLGDKKVLKHVEYERRPGKIIDYLGRGQNQNVLDIGCNWGYLLMWIKDKYPDCNCYGIDINMDCVEQGIRIAAENGYPINLAYGNAKDLQFGDNFFDYIVSTEAFEHIMIADRNRVLEECRRCLKPNGRLLITTPNKWGIAEIAKKFLGRFAVARKLIPMLPVPEEFTEEGFINRGVRTEDLMTNIPESATSFRVKAEKAGFEVLDQHNFIFIPEITPNLLFQAGCVLESLLEKIKIFNFTATTQFIMLKPIK